MPSERPLIEESTVLHDGPWVHRDVNANGIRLHVAEAGAGPLVVLLHGFPEFWWSWRHQLSGLADAGIHVVAPDLRGYGASDKPPRGYDAPTLAADIAGLIRALGVGQAVVVGHDWGATVGWSMAAAYPAIVSRLVVLSGPHPLRWLPALRGDGDQRRASGHLVRFQVPWAPERWLVENDAENVADLLHRWGGPGFPDALAERRYRDAMQILHVPNRALEYYRWSMRSLLRRSDGRPYRRMMQEPITVPTLALHGELDSCVVPNTAQGSGRYVSADYEWRLLKGVGHFPQEEAPDLITGEILRWCKSG
ncbi:MAG TPA: alpha/beta hydrolase [Mycobacteriales bacterium]|nr:alpha/beta hydrolase [Mycobacteriales bacterium]